MSTNDGTHDPRTNDTRNNAMLEGYVVEVMRRLPRKDRDGIGFELRGLLADMLADREAAEGRAADDAMVLAMLRAFGTPADVAGRYGPTGQLVIPADQMRIVVPLAIGGVMLQWALTLPRVFHDLPVAAWWLGPGLGALWWPGFLAVASFAAAWLRQRGKWPASDWTPRAYDPERVNRGLMAFGLLWFGFGVALMTSLPWLVPKMPAPMPTVLAFDPVFLHTRAWPAVLLWLGSFANLAMVLARGRWTPRTRRIELGFAIAFMALLGWWAADGPILRSAEGNAIAKLALGFVIILIAIDAVKKALRLSPRIRAPRLAG